MHTMVVQEVAPFTEEEDVPAAQGEQAIEPAKLAYWPERHEVQLEAPAAE